MTVPEVVAVDPDQVPDGLMAKLRAVFASWPDIPAAARWHAIATGAYPRLASEIDQAFSEVSSPSARAWVLHEPRWDDLMQEVALTAERRSAVIARVFEEAYGTGQRSPTKRRDNGVYFTPAVLSDEVVRL